MSEHQHTFFTTSRKSNTKYFKSYTVISLGTLTFLFAVIKPVKNVRMQVAVTDILLFFTAFLCSFFATIKSNNR